MDNNNRLLLQSGEGAGFPSSADTPENSLALPGSLSALSPSSGGSWYHPQDQIRPASHPFCWKLRPSDLRISCADLERAVFR